jgi:hypothetical protein
MITFAKTHRFEFFFLQIVCLNKGSSFNGSENISTYKYKYKYKFCVIFMKNIFPSGDSRSIDFDVNQISLLCNFLSNTLTFAKTHRFEFFSK